MQKDLTAAEAAHILGISLATLYSYVSRGLLVSSAAGSSRSKRYAHDAVLRLAARKADGKRAGHAAAAALNWGVPVLESRISLIANGRLHYRGHDAIGLAADATLERCALILWEREDGACFNAPAPPLDPALRAAARQLAGALPPLERAMACLPLLAGADNADGAGADLFVQGVRLMRLAASLLLDTGVSALPLHRQLALAWKMDDMDDTDGAAGAAGELLRAALVLLADHELNTSTFTVRCVASTGANLAAALGAGLAALSGPRHGGSSVAARVLIETALASGQAPAAFAARHLPDAGTREMTELPGFGHPLYPAGDSRAAYLLERLGRMRAGRPRIDGILALGTALGERCGAAPNADFALAALEAAFELPVTAGPVLFALARTAGWIAHAAEQMADGGMLRPRARYVGNFHALG